MNRRIMLFFVLVLAVGGCLGWMHFSVVPDIRWSNNGLVFYEDWKAIAKAWPIWLIAGSGAGLFGFIFFGLIAETARERDHKAKANEADQRAGEAEKIAESATQRAEAALNDDRSALQRQQETARQQIALAQSERKDADREIADIRAENKDQKAEIKHLYSRIRGFEVSAENGKAENKRLKEMKGDPEALAEANSEIAGLKSELKDTRQRLLNKR